MTSMTVAVRRQIERADTPIDGGFGDEYPKPEWNPAAAYSFWEQEQNIRRRYEGLKRSVEKMMGTETVDKCAVAYFDDDPSSEKPAVVQYLDALQSQAFDASVQVWINGGQAAVQAFEKSQVTAA